MVKFRITSERITEACNIMEYVLLQARNIETVVKVAPRFIVNKDDEYIVGVVLDEDGDISRFEGLQDAYQIMGSVTPKRLEKLTNEFVEAVRNIVNPTNEKG